jgi:hypothetical protein
MKSYPTPNLSHFSASSMLIPSLNASNYANPVPKLPSPDSILGTRAFQPHASDYALYEDVRKRIKSSISFPNNEPQFMPQSSTEMAFRGMSSKLAYPGVFHQNSQDFKSLQQAQYFEFLMNMKDKMQQPFQTFEKLPPNFMLPQKLNPPMPFQDSNFNIKVEDASLQGNPVKAPVKEGVKKSPSPSTKSERTESIPKCSSPMLCEAPALTEFTQHFDDWDLSSIFEFLRSGKSKEEFTIEKKGKLSKKFRAKRRRTTTPKTKKSKKDVKLESFEM